MKDTIWPEPEPGPKTQLATWRRVAGAPRSANIRTARSVTRSILPRPLLTTSKHNHKCRHMKTLKYVRANFSCESNARSERNPAMTATHPHATTHTELLGQLWLSTQLTLADVETADPARDTGTDIIAYDPDLTWFLPVQLKVLNTGGFRTEAKYLGRHLVLIYVILGLPDGGPANRPATEAYLLTPEEAWELPTELGRKWDPADHAWYGFGGLPSALLDRLSQYRLSTGPALARQLGDAARSASAASPGAASGLGPTAADERWRRCQAAGLRAAVTQVWSKLTNIVSALSPARLQVTNKCGREREQNHKVSVYGDGLIERPAEPD